MEDPDANNWAPQSPDLSSYHSSTTATDTAPVHPQHQGYRGSVSHISPYSPSLPNLNSSSPTLHSNSIPTFHPAAPLGPAPIPYNPSSTSTYASATTYMPRQIKQEEGVQMQDPDYIPDLSTTQRSTRGKKPKLEDEGIGAADSSSLLPNMDNIVIKNHFPVARIKRIMQADDDVGKVAQVTPVVVSKALELFMISLVTKAAAEAKAKNSKRVGTAHLKQAITKDEQFDFLSEIVSKVADAPAAADKNDPDAMEVDGKKRKSTGRKKKTKAEEDDF
ncbi:histone-fold-containing protein [Aaosphaeria arxii CBS 175.79]|uniref:NCT transcriptional regulatory complex subunit A n=1 Tax=Aaosphaeria arxii CBS 175.79 TaxID=1450172 RepID=A0A6A5XQD1_9PLEO|nr:histone-fold-containing protein [Aaosphaeria arxii CBS 175.79]KAF2015478.1 histone-fold-containing protein [Aaosphaeria arxii CBS 175.79]